MSEPTYLIYKHTSPSGKSYIGQTSNLQKRIREHQRSDSGCTAFKNAIQKYGWSSFTTEILACNLTLEESNILEEHFITQHNTLSPNGYNLRSGGESMLLSEDTKQKISKSLKGRPRPPEVIEKLKASGARRRGVPLSPERLQQIRDQNASRIGQPISNNHLQSIKENGIKRRGRPAHNKGKPVSDETKLKIQQSQKTNSENRKGCKRCIDPITGKISYRKPE